MEPLGHLNKQEQEELGKVFYSQAHETLEDMQDAVMGLEENPSSPETMQALKRYFHTLKGDSNGFGLTDIGTLCHRVEDVLGSLAEGQEKTFGPDEAALLLKCVDDMGDMLHQNETGNGGEKTTEEALGLIDEYLLSGGSPGQAKDQGENQSSAHGRLGFTEYEYLHMQEALKAGHLLHEINVTFHPLCGEKSVAALMLTQRLGNLGQIVKSTPDITEDDFQGADEVRVVLASDKSEQEISQELLITGITEKVDISPFVAPKRETEQEREEQDEKTPFAPSANAGAARLKSETLRVDSEKVDTIMNLVGELIISRSIIDQIAKDSEERNLDGELAERLYAVNSHMERTVSDLQKGVMKIRMVPVNHVFRKFPRIVKELAREKGKAIRLDIFGRETELDKGIVDALGEPLVHIVRNAIDHGIEDPQLRAGKGKPEEGVLTLRAYHEAAQIVIEVSDDGQGIDTGALKQKAVERGLLQHAEAEGMPEAEALSLVFLPGLSTSETVSDISGRGIGMDAVKTALEAMKGSVEVESQAGRGSLIRLRLPLTLAVMKALIFTVGQKTFAVPISAVAEVFGFQPDELVTLDGSETLVLRDKVISLINLGRLLGEGFSNGDNRDVGNVAQKGLSQGGTGRKFALVLGLGSKRVSLLADALYGQQELVIKALDASYTNSNLFSGASILGNGGIVLILDAPAILARAVADEKAALEAK